MATILYRWQLYIDGNYKLNVDLNI